MKVLPIEIDLLVDWAINDYGKINEYLNKGWLQLNDYDLFLKQMREIHYDRMHGHYSDYIKVDFNHYSDNKVHFKIFPYFREERIITYRQFSRNVWNYLKSVPIKNDEQITLF